jgi:hypothetical protein
MALVSMCLISLGFIYRSNIPQEIIKKIAILELEKAFQQKVTIEDISGNLFKQINLKNVRIFNNEFFEEGIMLEIGNIEANYSLIKAIRNRFDLLAGCSLIEMGKVRLNIIRSISDKWNVLFLMPPPPLDLPAPPLSLRGKLYITDFTIDFRDKKGWAEGRIEKPFKAQFKLSSGFLDFSDLNRVKMIFNGESKDNSGVVTIGGYLNAYDGQYDINFSFSKLDMDYWGPYVFPLKNFPISKNAFTVQGHLKSKVPFPEKDLPFWYYLKVNLKNNDFNTPFFDESLKDIKGNIELSHGKFTKQSVAKLLRVNGGNDFKQELWKELLKKQIIDDDGWLLARINPNQVGITFVLEKKFKKYKNRLVKLLIKQPTILRVNKLESTFYDIPLKIKGGLSLSDNKISTSLYSSVFELEKIKQLFPALKNWKFSGQGKAKVFITGKTTNPLISGEVTAPKMKVYGFRPEDINLKYKFKNKNLLLEISKGKLYNGDLRGTGTVEFAYSPPLIDLELIGNELKINKTFPSLNNNVQGTFNNITSVYGDTGGYEISSTVSGETLLVYSQNIATINTSLEVSNTTITINNVAVIINENKEKLNAHGSVHDFLDLKLKFSGANLNIKDIYSVNNVTNNGKLSITGDLSTKLNPTFWNKPYEEIRCTLDINAEQLRFYNQKYSSIVINTVYDKKNIFLEDFEAKTASGSIKLQGFYHNLKPYFISVLVDKLKIGESTLINKYIPQRAKPFSGDCTFEATILRNNKQTPIKFKNNKWLDNYSVLGRLQIQNGYFQGQKFNSFQIDGGWDGQLFSINESNLLHRSSKIKFSGEIDAKKNIDIKIKQGTSLDFFDFPIISANFGTLFGKADIIGTLTGAASKPNIDINIKAEDIKTNLLAIDEIEGRIRFENQKLTLSPIIIKQESDEYFIKGYLDFNSFLKNKKRAIKKLKYDLEIDLKEAQLSTLGNLLEAIYQEAGFRSKQFPSNAESFFSATNQIQGPMPHYSVFDRNFSDKRINLYTLDEESHSLSYFKEIDAIQTQMTTSEKIGLKESLSGSISCKLTAKSRKNKNPIISSKIFLENAKLFFIKANNIEIDFKTKGQDIKGRLLLENGSLVDRKYKKIESKLVFDKSGDLKILDTKLRLDSQENNDIITGSFPLSAYWDKEKSEAPIKLNIKLPGNSIGILSIFNGSISDIKNEGILDLELSGKLGAPIVNSRKANLKNTRIYFSEAVPIRSAFKIKDEQLIISNNRVLLSDIGIQWRGSDTKLFHTSQERLNSFAMSGFVEIQDLNFLTLLDLNIFMDISIQDTLFSINFPKIYKGDINMTNCAIKGQYHIPLSKKKKKENLKQVATEKEKGPLLSANLNLSSGEIVLPTLEKKELRPSFLLDINCNIKRDIGIGGSLFGEGVGNIFNMFDLSLEETEDPLLITGTLNAPSIKNNIVFYDGSINLFNRSFELLIPEKQRLFYQDDPTRVRDNSLSFTRQRINGSNKMRIVPVFDVAAVTIIENIITTENLQTEDPYKYVVINVKGPIYDLKNFKIEEYGGIDPEPKSDITLRNTYDFSRSGAGQVGDSQAVSTQVGTAGRNAEAVAKLLMPEILDRDSNGTTGDRDQTSQLLGDIGESQLNALFRRGLMRPLEKQLARKIGLYDLKVDYNVGGALLKNISGDDRSEENIGLDLITNLLSDQLFLRVKTDIETSSEENMLDTFRISEIELTYYIWRQLSINYANLREDEKVKYRTSLQYSYEF